MGWEMLVRFCEERLGHTDRSFILDRLIVGGGRRESFIYGTVLWWKGSSLGSISKNRSDDLVQGLFMAAAGAT